MDQGARFEQVRGKVEKEISECQKRVAQTLVPTILALGLIAIAKQENIRVITLGCTFAILFSSSLYVASLSYKIFRNASFIRVFLYGPWENALSKYHQRHRPLTPGRSETATAATIYIVLSFTFFFIFHEVNLIGSAVGTVILLCASFAILIVLIRARKMDETWKAIRPELEREYQQRNDTSHS